MKVGDKCVVALGSHRNGSGYAGGRLPIGMLKDGTVVTIEKIHEYHSAWVSVKECGFSYPISLLVPLSSKRILLNKIKDFK